MAQYFAQSVNHFSSSSELNGILESLSSAGIGFLALNNCCRCEMCPFCLCGSGFTCEDVGWERRWKVYSDVLFNSSMDAQSYCDSISGTVEMYVHRSEEFFMAGTTILTDCFTDIMSM